MLNVPEPHPLHRGSCICAGHHPTYGAALRVLTHSRLVVSSPTHAIGRRGGARKQRLDAHPRGAVDVTQNFRDVVQS